MPSAACCGAQPPGPQASSGQRTWSPRPDLQTKRLPSGSSRDFEGRSSKAKDMRNKLIEFAVERSGRRRANTGLHYTPPILDSRPNANAF